jgi:hypothetical protein
MRLPALAATLTLLTACLSEGGDAPADPQNLTVSWRFKDVGGNAIACPAGFTRLEVTITNEYDGYYQRRVEVPCAASEGTHTESIPTSGREEVEPGAYWTHGKIHDIKLRITDPSGESVAAEAPASVFESPFQVVRLVTLDQDRSVDFDIYPNAGFGISRWHLVSTLTGADLLSCAAAGVDTIRFTYFVGFYPGESAPIVTEWPCDANDLDYSIDPDSTELGSGRTRAVAPETYFGTFEALRNGVVVGTRGGDGDAIGFDSRPGQGHVITNSNITITDR